MCCTVLSIIYHHLPSSKSSSRPIFLHIFHFVYANKISPLQNKEVVCVWYFVILINALLCQFGKRIPDCISLCMVWTDRETYQILNIKGIGITITTTTEHTRTYTHSKNKCMDKISLEKQKVED